MAASAAASGAGGEAVVGGDVGAPLVAGAAVLDGVDGVVDRATVVEGAVDVVGRAVEPVSVVDAGGTVVVAAALVVTAEDAGPAASSSPLHATSVHATAATIVNRKHRPVPSIVTGGQRTQSPPANRAPRAWRRSVRAGRPAGDASGFVDLDHVPARIAGEALQAGADLDGIAHAHTVLA